jgi:hypothetical protein
VKKSNAEEEMNWRGEETKKIKRTNFVQIKWRTEKMTCY